MQQDSSPTAPIILHGIGDRKDSGVKAMVKATTSPGNLFRRERSHTSPPLSDLRVGLPGRMPQGKPREVPGHSLFSAA